LFSQLNYTKTSRFHAIFLPEIIEFSRYTSTYSSAKFELMNKIFLHFNSLIPLKIGG